MNESKPSTKGLIRIGELAASVGLNVTTLKFYAKEGLIRPVCKTGRNMAWYDPGCAATVKAIRTLQKEKYYPLAVIKRLLDSSEGSTEERALLDAIHKVDESATGEQISFDEALRRFPLSEEQIDALVKEGVIKPEGDSGERLLSEEDMTVISLVSRRMNEGIPFEQTLHSFRIYDRALKRAAQADVNSFISEVILMEDIDTETAEHLIKVSDESLDAFVGLKRKEYNRKYGSGHLESMYRFESGLHDALEKICHLLDDWGFKRFAELCSCALTGERVDGSPVMTEAARHYSEFMQRLGGDIAGAAAECANSRKYFTALDAEPDEDSAMALYCLKLCWLSLAPDILDCGEAAEKTMEEFREFLMREYPVMANTVFTQIKEVLNERR